MSNLGFNLIELNPYFPRPYVFSEAAICLRDSIREAGFICEYHANKLGCQLWSIVLGANEDSRFLSALPLEHTILFNFEQLESKSALVTKNYIKLLHSYPVFDYHQSNIDYLANYASSYSSFRHYEIPIVPSSNLLFRTSQVAIKDIDILFFGTPNNRRQKIIDQLRGLGLIVELISGAYGFELTSAIQRARLILHIHFYETSLATPLRFMQPIIQGVPIVSEVAYQPRYCDWTNSGIHFSKYQDIVSDCLNILKDQARQEHINVLNNQFVKNINFAYAFNLALQDLKVLNG